LINLAQRGQHRLGAFLSPQSVALVGVPGDPRLPLARPLQALAVHGFEGAVYPVNPKHQEIGGRRCYPTLRALPKPPDLAWIAVPSEQTIPVLDDCLAAGVQRAVMISAGFAEAGPEGALRQLEVERRVQRGLTVLGPNSIGFINVWDRMPLSFSAVLEISPFRPGGVAIVSQSGGFGGVILNQLQDRGVGVGYVVSTGNEADIGVEECLEYLVDEPHTRIIVVVVEGLRRPARFWRAAERAAAVGKPIVALRLGLSPLGEELTRTHTGAPSSRPEMWATQADRCGVLTVEDVEDVTDVVMWYERAGGTPLRRLAVVTSSGGVAVQLADSLTAEGFELPPLGDETRGRLRGLLPAYASPNNPLDITAALSEQTFKAAVATLVANEGVDTLILPMPMLGGRQSEERASMLARLTVQGPTVVVCWLAGSLAQPGLEVGDRAGLPSFTSVRRMVRTLAAVRRRQRTPAPGLPDAPGS
jgi:acyl-CoA synthetase (NDP forming)